MRVAQVVGVCLLAAVATRMQAADPPVPAEWPVAEAQKKLGLVRPTISADARRLVGELGAADAATRDRASAELKEKGAAAFPGLLPLVCETDNAEVVARTAGFLSADIATPPGLPALARKTIDEYVESRAILRRKPGTTLVPGTREPDSVMPSLPTELGTEGRARIVEVLLAHEPDPAFRKEIVARTEFTADFRARLAALSGEWDRAEAILRDAVTGTRYVGPPEYAAFVAQRRGAAFDAESTLDLLALGLRRDALREEAGYFLSRAAGELDRAADFAVGMPAEPNWPGLWPGLIEAGRYADLSQVIETRLDAGRQFPFAAVASRLAGHQVKADELVAAAVRATDRAATRGLDYSLRDLAVAGRAEDVIAIARRRPGLEIIAFRLLLRQGRMREALAVVADPTGVPIEIPRRLIDMGLSSEAREILLGIWPNPAQLGPKEALYKFELATELERVGEKARADQSRKAAIDLVDQYRRHYALITDVAWQANIAWGEVFQRRSHTDEEAAAASRRKSDADSLGGRYSQLDAQFISFRHASAMPRELRDLTWYWLEMQHLTDFPFPKLYDRATRIVAGTFPAEEIVKEAKAAKDFWRSDYEVRMVLLTLKHLRRFSLAKDLVEHGVRETGDPTWLAFLGDWALADGLPDEAIALYRRAAVLNLTDPSLMYRLGVAYSRRPESREAGRALMAFAPRLVWGDADRAFQLAESIRRYEGRAAGDQWFDDYTDRFGSWRIEQFAQHLARKRAAAEARGDYAAALRLAEESLFSPAMAEDDEYPPVLSAMDAVAAYHRARALDALARKDFATLADALGRHLDNGPPDVGLLEKAIPPLRAVDGAAAGAVLARAEGRLRPLVEDYPALKEYAAQLAGVQALKK
jgi:hypothetical protein